VTELQHCLAAHTGAKSSVGYLGTLTADSSLGSAQRHGPPLVIVKATAAAKRGRTAQKIHLTLCHHPHSTLAAPAAHRPGRVGRAHLRGTDVQMYAQAGRGQPRQQRGRRRDLAAMSNPVKSECGAGR